MVLKPYTPLPIITYPAPGTYSRRGHKAESSDPALKEVWRIKLRAQTGDQWLGKETHFGCAYQ